MTLIALAVSLDASIYGGYYMQAISRMFSEIAMHMR